MPVTVNVPTTDNFQPIWDENAPWRMWGIDDIFVGLEGKNRFVPKVNDYVINPLTAETWRVESVDLITYIPTLVKVNFGQSPEDPDILFGVGPGTQAQLLRVYINKASYPYRATVDTHCFIGGAFNNYAVIYKNGDPTIGGEPISKIFDSSGNFVSTNVPLEMVALDTHTNHAIKVVQQFHVTEDIPDGEPMTVVFYTADGVPTSKAILLVENTTYIRGLDVQRKFVTGISLESPWLSASDANVLKFPLNIPLNGLDLVGVVHYNTGMPLKLPVDGTKFRLDGIDGYISSIPGEKFDLSLVYNLSQDEIGYAGQGVYVDRVVTQPYSVVTEVVEPGYTVKLFMYPFFDDVLNGYRLRFWLYNLSRNSYQEVTQHITYNPGLPAFESRGYGFTQRLQANLNLRKVSMAYKPMIHTQMFEVTLFSDPDETITPWTVTPQISALNKVYGRELFVQRKSSTVFNLSSGFADRQEWFDAFYRNTVPLVDRRVEVNAPDPSYVEVSLDNGATWVSYYIADSWDADITTDKTLTLYTNVLLRFAKPLATGQMELSIAAATLRP